MDPAEELWWEESKGTWKLAASNNSKHFSKCFKCCFKLARKIRNSNKFWYKQTLSAYLDRTLMQKTSDNGSIGNSLQTNAFACVLSNLIDLQMISCKRYKNRVCPPYAISDAPVVTTAEKRLSRKTHTCDWGCELECALRVQAYWRTSYCRYGTSWHCWNLNFDESVGAAKGYYLLRNACRSQCKYISACRNLLICFSSARPQ